MAAAGPKYDPKNMIFRNLGNTGLKVSLFSYGGWLTVGGTVKGATVKDLMKVAFENGVNFYDQAEIYAGGESEREMGQAIKDLGWDRREIVLTTKIFFGTNSSKEPNQRGLSRKHLVEGTKGALERLQVDYVDVVFAHRYDPSTPMEEIVRGFNWIIEKGWAFYWGTSEWSAAQIAEAFAVADRLGLIGPIAEQCEYSALKRDRLEEEYKGLFKTKGYGTTIWSPLASGVLTGKYDGAAAPAGSRYDTNQAFFGSSDDKFKEPEMIAKIEKTKNLKPIADKLGVSRASLALAWAATNPNVSTLILGATKPEQLIENFKALDVIPLLTPEILEEIEKALDNKPVPAATYGR